MKLDILKKLIDSFVETGYIESIDNLEEDDDFTEMVYINWKCNDININNCIYSFVLSTPEIDVDDSGNKIPETYTKNKIKKGAYITIVKTTNNKKYIIDGIEASKLTPILFNKLYNRIKHLIQLYNQIYY